MPLNLKALNVDLDEVSDITVTPIETALDGSYVREFRFYGAAPSAGAPRPQILVVRVTSDTKEDIDVTVPALTF